MTVLGKSGSTGSSPMGAAERSLRTKRIVSLAASTMISLAAGTNYVYSAYAPQLGEELQLSAKQINLIGTFGNLGMYVAGIPSGMIVDKSPRLPILFGGLCLITGYYPIHLAMARGYGSMGVPALCFFSALTGVGSCCAFGGALKIAALNFPFNRGTATAIALAAFGLSAFFFSSLSSFLFPGNSANFLFLLATATSGICILGYFFCRVVPASTYSTLPESEPSNRLHRTRSGESAKSSSHRFGPPSDDIGTPNSPNSYTFPSSSSSAAGLYSFSGIPNTGDDATEASSLFTKSSSESDEDERRRDLEASAMAPHNSGRRYGLAEDDDADNTTRADISGWALATSSDFWILFGIMAALAGVGLMTINNIGQDVRSLLEILPTPPSDTAKAQLQSLQVSLISICSCISRIISGSFSDRLAASKLPRHICLFASSFLALLATISALIISTPSTLPILSILTGLSYGTLFGVAPTIVSETFGVARMSTNWGALTIGAVVGGNIGNMWYGAVVDSLRGSDGVCRLGKGCYQSAYLLGAGMAIIGGGMAAWGVRRNWRTGAMKGKGIAKA